MSVSQPPSVSSLPRRTSRSKTRDLRFSIRINAKPEDVYRALTSARELCRWWLLGAETDARNVGRLRMVWPRPKRGSGRNGPGFGEREGQFVDLEPGRKVAWVWKPAARDRLAPLLCTFFIERRGRRYAAGWEDALTKLRLYLETGRTCKAEIVTFSQFESLRKAGR